MKAGGTPANLRPGKQTRKVKQRREYVWLDIVGLLFRAPRSAAELQELTGLCSTTVYHHLRALGDEGLVVRARCKRGDGEVIGWAWVSPLAKQDVPTLIRTARAALEQVERMAA
jgi:DNA-binding transcriptional ArsR family regulator